MVLLCYPKLKFSGFWFAYSPIILINHALTGNSQVIGESGWWNDIVGVDKTIDIENILLFLLTGMVSIQLQLKIIEILLREILLEFLLKGYVY
jgi:hypothetical protein